MDIAIDEERDWLEWSERLRERAARAYVVERCSRRLFIECREVERLTGWQPPRIRRFICAVQDTWRSSQGFRPRGRPRRIP